jgi:hypothetical protein
MEKNVLFISLGAFAFGESTLALNFARGLENSYYQPFFILSPINQVIFNSLPQLKKILLYPNGGRINRILAEDFLTEYPPDIILLFDFLTFEYSNNFGLSLEYLRSFNTPIISLDSYEWESTDFILDFLGGRSKQVASTLLEIDGCLRPCPLNKPIPLQDHFACYSFFKEVRTTDINNLSLYREKLDINSSDKIVFSATAPWEKKPAKEVRQTPFCHVVPKLVEFYLTQVNCHIHWVRVGRDIQNKEEVHSNLTVHNFKFLPSDDFNNLLYLSDILITTNIAATTLAKKVCSGGAALLLFNSVNANCSGDLYRYKSMTFSSSITEIIQKCYPISPFRMFPLGWYDFLTPLVNENSYLNTFYQAEILDSEAVISSLNQALFSSNEFKLMHLEEYKQALKALPTPAECLDYFLNS